MKVPKLTLLFKDESGQEFSVHLWGRRFVDKGKDIAVGSVVQVDNALLSKIPAGIEASWEYWPDSSKNMFSAQDLALGNYRPCRRLEARHSPCLGSRQLRVGWCSAVGKDDVASVRAISRMCKMY